MRRVLLSLLALAMALPILALHPASASAKPIAATSAACPTPPLAQKLADVATKVQARPAVDGQRVTRFYLPASAMQSVEVIALAGAASPHAQQAGYRWYYDATTWIEWFESDPCGGPDGYAFGFNARCWRTTSSTGSPRTNVACNWDANAGLEYDHAVHDFDPVWGLKNYNELNQGSCADTGGYHFFSDSSPGELRTWLRVMVRFLAINYPSQPRKTTSRHVVIATKSEHQGIGVGEWLSSLTDPGDGDDDC
jgi:hypothetical protein